MIIVTLGGIDGETSSTVGPLFETLGCKMPKINEILLTHVIGRLDTLAIWCLTLYFSQRYCNEWIQLLQYQFHVKECFQTLYIARLWTHVLKLGDRTWPKIVSKSYNKKGALQIVFKKVSHVTLHVMKT